MDAPAPGHVRSGMGLRTRILVPSACIVAATVATVTVLAAYSIRATLEQRAISTYSAFTDQLCEASALAAASSRAGDLPSYLDVLARRDDVRWVEVYGANGTCLYRRPAERVPGVPLAGGFPARREFLRGRQIEGVADAALLEIRSPILFGAPQPLEPAGEPLEAHLKLPDEKAEDTAQREPAAWEVVGAVRLGISLEPSFAQARAIAAGLLAAATLVAAVGILLTWLLTRQVARPVKDLLDGTSAISSGRFDRKVEVPRTREFALLARAFNDMADRLRAYDAQIRNQNQLLEQRVTERTAELTRALEELQRLDILKDEFLSNVSHELRTPMTSIRSFAEILRDYADEDPETRREFLEIIMAESERLTRLIEEILDLSKISAGKAAWCFELLRIERALEEVALSVQATQGADGVQVHVQLDADLPQLAADRDRLRQVWTNLLANAVKFTPAGRNVFVRAYAAADQVVVEVRDEGPGIDPRHHQAVFDRFRQLGNARTGKPTGTGLGLAITKEIIERHRGRIELESAPGRGSTFRVVLPVLAVEELEGLPAQPAVSGA